MHINADMTIYIIQSFINKLAVTMRINNHDIYTAGAVMRPSWDAQIRTYRNYAKTNQSCTNEKTRNSKSIDDIH